MLNFEFKSICYRYIKKLYNEIYVALASTEMKPVIILTFSVLLLGFVIPSVISYDMPYGTDVFTHLIYTKIMGNSKSLEEFYDYCIKNYYKEYGYPFGLWLFGSIVMKITGLELLSLAIIVPFITLIIFLFLYFNFSQLFVASDDTQIKCKIGLLSVIFLLTTPKFCMSILNYSSSIFMMFVVVLIIYVLLNNKINLFKKFIFLILALFTLLITHTGTYIFMMFLLMTFLVIYCIATGKINKLVFVTFTLQLLYLVLILGSTFKYIHYQYLDKGRILTSVGESIYSLTGIKIAVDFTELLYKEVFVNLNILFVVLWISLLYSVLRIIMIVRPKVISGLKKYFIKIKKENLLPAVALSGIRHIPHGILYWPVWLGPLQTVFATLGLLRVNSYGLYLFLSVALIAVPTGSLAEERALRELQYFYIIFPILSAIGFKYIYNKFKNKYKNVSKSKYIQLAYLFLFSLIFSTIVVLPIIGNLYYHPLISGPKYERDGMKWLSKVGNSNEGAAGLVGSRVAIYSDKIPVAVTSVSAGSESKRFGKDVYHILFDRNSEDYARDLFTAFGVKYYILIEKVSRVYKLPLNAITIDDNVQLDKIYSSKNKFSIYSQISYPTKREKIESNIVFDVTPTIKDAGTGYLVETDYYKVRLKKENPEIAYLGNTTVNLLGEGGTFDIVSLSCSKENISDAWIIQDQTYSSITLGKNKIIYRTTLKDEKTKENIATLIVKYTFYDRAFRKDIILINDRINNVVECSYMHKFFTPLNNFDIYLNNILTKKRLIYPSEDVVVVNDVKFNELYLYKGDGGIYVYYEKAAPYPDEIAYKGSTAYLFKYYSVSSKLRKYLAPGEGMHTVQWISIGNSTEAKENVRRYLISVYPYPHGEIPIILICKNMYGELEDELKILNVTYIAVSSSDYSSTLNGYIIDKIGLMPENLKYDLRTLKMLNESGFKFIIGKKIRLPFYIYNREGFRSPQKLYDHGKELNLVLLPVSKPIVREHTRDWEKIFSVIDSAVKDEDLIVFVWDVKKVRDISNLVNIIKYTKTMNLKFTTPAKIAEYQRLLKNINIYINNFNDTMRITIFNNNSKSVKGFTVKVTLKHGNCQINGGTMVKRIYTGGAYLYYISTDLDPNCVHSITISA